MKSFARRLGLLLVGLFVALVIATILYPSKGLYFGQYSSMRYVFLYVNILAMTLLTAWSVFSSKPLIVRLSATFALASLMVGNLAFSAPMWRAMKHKDGIALLVCFVLVPWLLMSAAKVIPKIGICLSKIHEDEFRVTRQKLHVGDMISTTLFVAVGIYIFLSVFPSKRMNATGWMRDASARWEEPLMTGVVLALISTFAFWSGMNTRRWVVGVFFVPAFLLMMWTVVFSISSPETEFKHVAEFYVGVAAFLLIPLGLRLAGYRMVSRKNAVFVHQDATADKKTRWSAFSSLSIPIVAVCALWLLSANLGGAMQRHEFHCAGEFVYGNEIPAEDAGILTSVDISIEYGERMLRSKLFPSLTHLVLGEDEEVTDELIESIIDSESLDVLEIRDAHLSAKQFMALAGGKSWSELNLAYPFGLQEAIRAAEESQTLPDATIDKLVFRIEDDFDSKAMTTSALNRILNFASPKKIVLDNPSYFNRPKFPGDAIGSLVEQYQTTTMTLPHPRGGQMTVRDDSVRFDNAGIFESETVSLIRVLKPKRLFVEGSPDVTRLPSESDESDVGMFMLDEKDEPEELTDEQIKMLAETKMISKCLETVATTSEIADSDRFLEHFVTADAVELVLTTRGFSTSLAEKIARRTNIHTLTLSCDYIEPGALEALQNANGLKVVYYWPLESPEAIDDLKSKLENVKVLPQSERGPIPGVQDW